MSHTDNECLKNGRIKRCHSDPHPVITPLILPIVVREATTGTGGVVYPTETDAIGGSSYHHPSEHPETGELKHFQSDVSHMNVLDIRDSYSNKPLRYPRMIHPEYIPRIHHILLTCRKSIFG